MLKQGESSKERKFSWVDKWAEMTGERAKIDAKVNNTYIVYRKNNELVKEYPNGKVVPLNKEFDGIVHD